MSSATLVGLLVTICLLLGLTAIAWRHREKPAAKPFAALQVLSSLWATVTVAGLSMPPGSTRIRVWGVATGLSLLVVILWFAFILSYTGRNSLLTVRRLGAISTPLVVGAVIYFVAPTWAPLVGRLTQEQIGAGTVVVASIGPVGAVLGAYLYLVFIVGLGFVGKTVLEGSRLFAGQALALLAGSLVTITASALVIFGFPVDGYPLTQVALGIQALFWGYAVFGQQFLRVIPAVAKIGEAAVVKNLNDGVLVVDENGVIIRANQRARSYLGVESPTGEPVESVLDTMGVAALDALPTRFERGGRTYRTDSSKIRNWQGEAIGQTLLIRDISTLVTREQRLTVLNRILRHNVRNKMSIVLLTGERIGEHSDEQLAALGDRLARTADDLTTTSNKAIELDRLIAAPAEHDAVDLAQLVAQVVGSLADRYPGATVKQTVDGQIRTDRQVLARILEEVIQNALEHTGPNPAVTVETTTTQDGVRITVADDGPGIPEAEIEPVSSGGETALEHASSLGLWFIYWGTQTLDGEVTFETTPDGSLVSIAVPDTPGENSTD